MFAQYHAAADEYWTEDSMNSPLYHMHRNPPFFVLHFFSFLFLIGCSHWCEAQGKFTLMGSKTIYGMYRQYSVDCQNGMIRENENRNFYTQRQWNNSAFLQHRMDGWMDDCFFCWLFSILDHELYISTNDCYYLTQGSFLLTRKSIVLQHTEGTTIPYTSDRVHSLFFSHTHFKWTKKKIDENEHKTFIQEHLNASPMNEVNHRFRQLHEHNIKLNESENDKINDILTWKSTNICRARKVHLNFEMRFDIKTFIQNLSDAHAPAADFSFV